MLKQITLKNFTVFPEADLHFASGLNVIVGENGCGKTHLLKVTYALIEAVAENTGINPTVKKLSNNVLKDKYHKKLSGTFSSSIESLSRKRNVVNKKDTPINVVIPIFYISLFFKDSKFNVSISQSATDLYIDKTPKVWGDKRPVFMPTRELLTIYPGFVSIYENHYLEFDETYRDTCVLLGLPALKGKREQQAKEMLKPLEEAMGGEVLLEGGRFYLNMPDKGKIEMPMVAEGQRKLAMLAQLIATGALLDKGYLFWDEPEANLNPKLIKLIAKVILHLCNNGIQVFIASHSLFLVRELEILSAKEEFKNTTQRYFALRIEDDGVIVEQGDVIDDLQTLILLDEELSQSDRFMQMGD
jgi:energy-coupling factor transporter ATP-binding protein EcfA2